MKFEDSSLLLRTTVYYPSTYASEVIYTDINLRVQDALKENGIEIPYQYINIMYCGPEKRSSHTPPQSV